MSAPNQWWWSIVMFRWPDRAKTDSKLKVSSIRCWRPRQPIFFHRDATNGPVNWSGYQPYQTGIPAFGCPWDLIAFRLLALPAAHWSYSFSGNFDNLRFQMEFSRSYSWMGLSHGDSSGAWLRTSVTGQHVQSQSNLFIFFLGSDEQSESRLRRDYSRSYCRSRRGVHYRNESSISAPGISHLQWF